MYGEADRIDSLVKAAKTLVVVQADNPDADSLGSALALEHILGDLGKQVRLYCSVEMPGYLRYLRGWDRVERDVPSSFDASIIVDASTMTLFEKPSAPNPKSWLAHKPCLILDHHATVDNMIPFAEITLNDPQRAATGELVYQLARQLAWPLSLEAQTFIMTAILGDTQGLTNQLTSAETYRIMAAMVEAGVDRSSLEDMRREFSKMPPLIFRYKAELLRRTEFNHDGAIASVHVPQVEINQYSPLYNPAPLVQGDMLQTVGVGVAIVFKSYDDGKVTAAIRCNPGSGIAAELAGHFGGGGHTYASGFKVVSSRPFNEIKSECIKQAAQLLAKLEKDKPDETLQHTQPTN